MPALWRQARLKRLRRCLLFLHTFWTSSRWLAKRQVKKSRNFVTALALGKALWLSSRQRVDRWPGSLWWRRMKLCHRCPIYDRGRKACGRLNDDLGCGCFEPLKNGLPEADCWLWVNTNREMGHDFSFGVASSATVR